MVETTYFGWVSIAYWEYSVMLFYIFAMFLYFAREKNMRISSEPEYRYFLWGLYAKVFGSIFFSLIYFYYYTGGDTIGYFYSALALANVAKNDPIAYLGLLFGPNDVENLSNFSLETGYPYAFLYFDSRSYMVIRLVSPIILLAFDSYLITTVIVASISYIGIWRCYRTFARYFPNLRGQLAVAFLFMPSCIFWGSGILKDTFTFSALCWYLHCVDNIFFRKWRVPYSIVALLISAWLLVAIKPYIFMALFPLSLVWIFYSRLSRFRNAMVRYILLPVAFSFLVVATFVLLSSLGENLGKFSLDNALDTIIVTQNDLTRVEEYGTNYFDIGHLDPTWGSVLSKWPVATNAALFRPYLWECKNVVMTLAGLENLFLMIITVQLLFRSRITFILTIMMKNPMVLLCILFAVVYGFITGITTPNFGALVRFKIPLLPLFVSGIFIMMYLLRQRRLALERGRVFRFEDYVQGEPYVAGPVAVVGTARRPRTSR